MGVRSRWNPGNPIRKGVTSRTLINFGPGNFGWYFLKGTKGSAVIWVGRMFCLCGESLFGLDQEEQELGQFPQILFGQGFQRDLEWWGNSL